MCRSHHFQLIPRILSKSKIQMFSIYGSLIISGGKPNHRAEFGDWRSRAKSQHAYKEPAIFPPLDDSGRLWGFWTGRRRSGAAPTPPAPRPSPSSPPSSSTPSATPHKSQGVADQLFCVRALNLLILVFLQRFLKVQSRTRKRWYRYTKHQSYGDLITEDLRFLKVLAKKRKDLSLQVGDLVFNWRNSPKWIGKTTIWDGRMEAIFASFLYRIRLKDELLTPHYVKILFNNS